LPIFGLTEEQVSAFGMSFGIGACMRYRLVIAGELARMARAGRTGACVVFFVLLLGLFGFDSTSMMKI